MTERLTVSKNCFQVKNYCFIFYSVCCIWLVAAFSSAGASELHDVEIRQTQNEQEIAELKKELQKVKERFTQLISVVSSLFIDTENI